MDRARTPEERLREVAERLRERACSLPATAPTEPAPVPTPSAPTDHSPAAKPGSSPSPARHWSEVGERDDDEDASKVIALAGDLHHAVLKEITR